MYTTGNLTPDPFDSGFSIASWPMAPELTKSHCRDIGNGKPCELVPYTANNPICQECSVRVGLPFCNHTKEQRMEIIALIKSGVNFDAVNQPKDKAPELPKVCRICGEKAIAKDLCSKHYQEQYYHGKIGPHKTIRRYVDKKDALEQNIAKQLDGCWIWTGYTDKGTSPVISYRKKVFNAKALSCEVAGKAFKKRLQWRSTCDNPLCVNPEHLYQIEFATKKEVK